MTRDEERERFIKLIGKGYQEMGNINLSISEEFMSFEGKEFIINDQMINKIKGDVHFD